MLLSLFTLREMNLELLMGRGAASPHLKPNSGLANLFACVSPRALPPQRHDPVDKMANIYGGRIRGVLPYGPASVLQAVVSSYLVLTQHLLLCYPNCVMSNNSFHSPSSIGDPERLIGCPEGGRLVMFELILFTCRNKR